LLALLRLRSLATGSGICRDLSQAGRRRGASRHRIKDRRQSLLPNGTPLLLGELADIFAQQAADIAL
jgi:hypothetical protein